MANLRESPDRYSWEGFNSAKEEFRRIDLEQWIRHEKIRQKGTAEGEVNMPGPDATVLDATESKIVDYFNEQINFTREKVNQHLSDLIQDVLVLEDSEDLRNIKRDTENKEYDAITAIDQAYNTEHNTLQPKSSDLKLARDDFDEFRDSNRLKRPADYSHRKWAIPTILMCFGLETALNATLLMEVNVFGLIGSMAQMALISALNVLIASFAMGGLLRRTHLLQVQMKILAWTAIGILLIFVVGFNLFVGHIREGMEMIVNDSNFDLQQLGSLVTQRFSEGPLDLGFQSVLLVILGLAFFGVASWKWLHRDDMFPQFGKRDRQLKEMEQAYSAEANNSERRLRRVFEEKRDFLKDEKHRLDVNKGKLKISKNRGDKILDDYKHFVPECQRDLDYLLSEYRDANLKARTKPPPKHFNEKPQIDASAYIPPKFEIPDLNPIEEVAMALQTAVKKIQEEYRSKLNLLQQLGEQKAEES